jgi:hypothetical protein
MKERLKQKLFGKRFYSIYRRLRYVRYLKKKKKERKKEILLENLREKREFKINLQKQKQKEKDLFRKKSKIEKAEKKELTLQAIREIRDKLKAEQKIEKIKKGHGKLQIKNEKQEFRAKLKALSQTDRKLEIEKRKNEKIQKTLFKIQQKKRRRRLINYLLKKNLKQFINDLKNPNRQTFRKWFRWIVVVVENERHRNNFLIISINSFALFVLSYFVMYMISHALTTWIALSFDYKTILFYYKIYYNIDTSDWTADSVKILYSIQPLTGLIIGVVFIIVFSIFRNETGRFKLFFLWGFIHGMVMFFGALLMGTLLNKDFGWVITYLYYRDTGKMIFSIISIFSLIIIGSAVARAFLISGNAYFNWISKNDRKLLLTSQVIIPAILGSLIIAFYELPYDFYYITKDEVFFEFLKISTIILVLFPIAIVFGTFNDIYFDEEPRKIRIQWWVIILVVALLVTFRLLTYDGMHFE